MYIYILNNITIKDNSSNKQVHYNLKKNENKKRSLPGGRET